MIGKKDYGTKKAKAKKSMVAKKPKPKAKK